MIKTIKHSDTKNDEEIVDGVFPTMEDISDEQEFIKLIKTKEENTHYENNELDLRIEEMIEKHESMFKCKVCGKTVKWKGEMKKHAETHIEGIFHACQVCSKMFPTRHNLQTHIFRIHSELFSCNVCGKTEMNRKAYRYHKRRNYCSLSVK